MHRERQTARRLNPSRGESGDGRGEGPTVGKQDLVSFEEVTVEALVGYRLRFYSRHVCGFSSSREVGSREPRAHLYRRWCLSRCDKPVRVERTEWPATDGRCAALRGATRRRATSSTTWRCSAVQ